MQFKLLPNTIFFLLVFLPHFLAAQITKPDTSFVQVAVAGAVDAYRELIGLQSPLYNGPEYVDNSLSYVDGHQFFRQSTQREGSVLFERTWHPDVSMLYDLVTDHVVIYQGGSGIPQKLVSEKVEKFILLGHTFVFLKKDAAPNSPWLQPGFYDLLFNGDLKVYVKRRKVVQTQATSRGMEGNYDIINKFYLLKEGTFFPVSSKNSVYKVLNDKRKELKKYARTNKLNFRKQREKSITQLAAYYETLKP